MDHSPTAAVDVAVVEEVAQTDCALEVAVVVVVVVLPRRR